MNALMKHNNTQQHTTTHNNTQQHTTHINTQHITTQTHTPTTRPLREVKDPNLPFRFLVIISAVEIVIDDAIR